VIALRWAAKYYAAEREFALGLMKDCSRPPRAGYGKPRTTHGYWREVEKQAEAKREAD